MNWRALKVMTLVAATACSGGDADSESAAEADASTEAPMEVHIVTPADGETVSSPVRVVFEVTGLEIVPAGTDQPRSGHHHILIDSDIPPAGAPVPSTAGYSHYGQAQTEADLELAPGEHRLIAVVADFAHVPLQPLVVDTVTVVVR